MQTHAAATEHEQDVMFTQLRPTIVNCGRHHSHACGLPTLARTHLECHIIKKTLSAAPRPAIKAPLSMHQSRRVDQKLQK